MFGQNTLPANGYFIHVLKNAFKRMPSTLHFINQSFLWPSNVSPLTWTVWLEIAFLITERKAHLFLVLLDSMCSLTVFLRSQFQFDFVKWLTLLLLWAVVSEVYKMKWLVHRNMWNRSLHSQCKYHRLKNIFLLIMFYSTRNPYLEIRFIWYQVG